MNSIHAHPDKYFIVNQGVLEFLIYSVTRNRKLDSYSRSKIFIAIATTAKRSLCTFG